MKYSYTILLLTIFFLDLSAQARLTSNRLSVGSLTAASETLEVFGDGQITGTNPFLRFKLTDAVPSSGDESGLHWKSSDNTTDMRMLYSWLDDRLYFLPDTDQNFAHLSIENATGHVGINVRNPLEQFHVAGKMFITDDIRFDGPEYLQWEESGTRKAYLRYTGTDVIIENDENDGWITMDAEAQLKLNTDDIQRMVIKKDGLVGIGTDSPTQLLDVEGDITLPAGSSYAFDESGVEKAGVGYNGTNMFVVNVETGGAVTVGAESHVVMSTNGVEKMRVALNGNVGIGTTSPTEKLQVNGGIRIGAATGNGAGTIRYTGSDFEGRVGSNWESLTGGGSGSVWTVSGANTFFNSGNVGIGTNSPAHKLQVNGDIGMTGEIIGVSDLRTKKSIQDMTEANSIISQLRPVSYEFSSEDFENLELPNGTQYGFIAQEVESVLPNLVSHSTTTEMKGVQTELKGINYIQMIPVLTKALQEQQSLINNQQAQIDELKSLVNTLAKSK